MNISGNRFILECEKNFNLNVLGAIGFWKLCTFCIMGQQLNIFNELNLLKVSLGKPSITKCV